MRDFRLDGDGEVVGRVLKGWVLPRLAWRSRTDTAVETRFCWLPSGIKSTCNGLTLTEDFRTKSGRTHQILNYLLNDLVRAELYHIRGFPVIG